MFVFVSDAKISSGKQFGAKSMQKEPNMEKFSLARPCSLMARPCVPVAVKKSENPG